MNIDERERESEREERESFFPVRLQLKSTSARSVSLENRSQVQRAAIVFNTMCGRHPDSGAERRVLIEKLLF